MKAKLINFEPYEIEKIKELFPGIILIDERLTDERPNITLNKNKLAFAEPFDLAVYFLYHLAHYNGQEYVQDPEDPIICE